MTRDDRKIRTALAVAALQPCLMCDGPPEVTGCFTPDDPRAFGAPLGKTRLIFFALCQGCFERTTIEQRETRLEQRLGLGRAA